MRERLNAILHELDALCEMEGQTDFILIVNRHIRPVTNEFGDKVAVDENDEVIMDYGGTDFYTNQKVEFAVNHLSCIGRDIEDNPEPTTSKFKPY